MIPKLPPPIKEVVVPQAFSIAALGFYTECPLRAVLSSIRGLAARLPSHPSAERGAIFHALLERAGKGIVQRLPCSRMSVHRELVALLNIAEARLAKDPTTAHFANLQSTLSEVDWHNKTAEVLLDAEALLDAAPNNYHAIRSQGAGQSYDLGSTVLNFSQLQREGTFYEVPIKSDKLRIAGRMDRVEVSRRNKIKIYDYKTGRVLDHDGEVRKHIALQLQLYALAVEEAFPNSEVELYVLKGSSSHRVPWDGGVRAKTKDFCQLVFSKLSVSTVLIADELARTGALCSTCPYRHVCSRYILTAPHAWSVGYETRLFPLDTWGILRERHQTELGVSLSLTDSAGRNVQVQRIDNRHGNLEDYEIGQNIYLFGLVAAQRSRHHKREFHPRNFFELPSVSLPVRAWSLAIFRNRTN